MDVSVIIPSKNEAATIGDVVAQIREILPGAEVLVVDDGSTDSTPVIAADAGAQVIHHPESLGNGAAIKSGARSARGAILVFMDADGQHDPSDIPKLLLELDRGYRMAIGARNRSSHANPARWAANTIYNTLASIMTNKPIPDLTSGFRAVFAVDFKKYLHLLPNGFSYPTTITMAFHRAGLPVKFCPIKAGKRQGKSHINPLVDGLRFFLIIFKVATLYSPLKIFMPSSALFFLTGVSYYAYTFYSEGRFTNMSLLLFSAAVIIFLIGLVSEQITALHYKDTE